MGLETAVAIAAIAGSVATTASALGIIGPKQPKAPEPVTPTMSPEEAPVAQRTAEDKARRRAMAAAAQNSTILTSTTGVTGQPRSLLGG